MVLNRELYRRAHKAYLEWNEAVAAERVRNAGKLSPQDAWRQYVSLVEFCWRLCPRQSPHQREEKLAALDQYYDRVRRLEAWRRERAARP